MLTIDEIRHSFPHLSRCTYLNTASAGVSWQGQGRAAAEFYDADKARGIGGMEEWGAKADAARAELAFLLGVEPRRIQFVGSTTEALNLVALSLPLGPGDLVAVAEDEFPSVVLPWATHQRRGVEVVRVPIPSETERSAALAAAIDGRVKVLAVSHVHWRTGTRVDLQQLGAVCRQHDCRLIVDGVQAVGAVPVDAANTDAYCASVFKWLLSGFGLGFVVLGESLAASLNPALRGYSNEPPSRSIHYGHINYPGIYALHASLLYMRSVGWENIHARVAALASHMAAGLRAEGFEVLTPGTAHAGIVSVLHPRCSVLVRALAQQSIFVEDGRPVIRASPHFYNTEAEIERFVAELARAA